MRPMSAPNPESCPVCGVPVTPAPLLPRLESDAPVGESEYYGTVLIGGEGEK